MYRYIICRMRLYVLTMSRINRKTGDKIIEGIMTYNIRNPKVSTAPGNEEYWGKLFKEDLNFLSLWIENLNEIKMVNEYVEYNDKWSIKLLESFSPEVIYKILTSVHETEEENIIGILKEITPINSE